MRIGELPVGARLIYGTYDDDDIRWIKVSESSDFLAETRTGVLQYDNIEGTNASRARRRFGNNFFPQSNIAQWLNAEGTDWFRNTHEHDSAPNFYHFPGFLNSFTQKELESIEDREITVAVPLGSRKEFGRTYKARMKVCLPSASEVGMEDEDLACEGETLPEIGNYLSGVRNESMMTRTGVKEGGHIISYFGLTPDAVVSYRPWGIHPMIRIKPDTEISEAPDHSGCFYVPDTEFINKFLEILSFD